MFKLRLLISVLFVASSLASTAMTATESPSTATADSKLEAIHRWFIASQAPETGLVPTREGKEGICFTYDQALAVYAFLLFDDVERARKILDFYLKEYQTQLEQGRFIGYTDMYFSTGADGAVYRAVGPNAWLLNAINYYTHRTQDTKYLALGEALAKWIIDLQAIDGGMMGGFHPNLNWISTEHNLDAYCALRNLYALTKNKIYAEKAEEIKIWLQKVAWLPNEKRFGNGKSDPNFALDVSSWAVLALGTEYVPTLTHAEEVTRNKQFYTAGQCEVDGFDFGGPYVGTLMPDKDAVWFEGTGQMVVAYLIAGNKEKADFFSNQLEKCLTPSTNHPNTLGLPYASNPGTPPYGGWQMTDSPLCISSPAWYLFAKKGFNPFNFGGKLVADDKELGWPVAGIKPQDHPAKQFVPVVDDFEHSVAQFLTSYPDTGIERSNCLFHRSLEFNERRGGDQALRLIFIPRGITGVQGEFSKSELYAFPETQEASTIFKTSSQPDYTKEEEAEEKEAAMQQIEPSIPAATKQPAQAVIRRKFVAPQQWGGKTKLQVSLLHDNSPNIFFIGLKDQEGRIWLSKDLSLEGAGWVDHALDLKQDFRLLGNPGDSAAAPLGSVVEIWYGLRSSTPLTESIICLDNVQLQ